MMDTDSEDIVDQDSAIKDSDIDNDDEIDDQSQNPGVTQDISAAKDYLTTLQAGLTAEGLATGQNATKTSLSSGLPTDKIAQAINNVDFKLGLDNASASMIREHIMKNEDRDLMRRHAAVMGDNEFFHQFLSKYQKGLSRALKKTLEK